MRGRSNPERNKAGRKKTGGGKAATARPRRRPMVRSKPPAAKREPAVARIKRELAEVTEQQRATEDVLQVISSASGDLQQIFATILENAVQVSRAANGVINRWDGEALHLVATHNMPAAFTEIRQRLPYRPDQHSASGRMLASRGYVHIADLAADRSYAERNPPTVAAVEIGGIRTTLAIPMMKDGQFIGSFTVGRTKVQPFTARQIEVVTSFANQAVIAVENARLFHELREALQQQTATSKVLQVISNSPGILEPAFDTVLENAMQLCDAEFGNIYTWDGEALHLVAWHNTPAAFAAYRTRGPFRPSATSLIGRMVRTKSVMHVHDATDNPDYTERRDPSLVAAIELGGVRTYLGVPMMKENEVIGAITIFRQEVRPFTERQIAMLTGFADQAAIALEKGRLIHELRARTDDLDRSIGELQRERNNKLMNLEAMVASISHEVRQPLASIASNGGAALRFLKHEPPNLDEARSALNSMVQGSHRASKVFDNIRALFGKADQGHEPIKVNKLALGVLHTLRDDLKDRGITTRTALRSELPPIAGHEGQLQEVLINLVRNAIEAMDSVEQDRRVLQVRAEQHGESAVALYVEDSGTGIDPKQLDNIFDAFITTKPSGMGLGLAICRMIIERHAGQLSVSPAQPNGSIFRVLLPAGQAAPAAGDERKAREPARH